MYIKLRYHYMACAIAASFTRSSLDAAVWLKACWKLPEILLLSADGSMGRQEWVATLYEAVAYLS